jgi:hypothetical protein
MSIVSLRAPGRRATRRATRPISNW